MVLLFVSTFPPFECGIATYTKYLVDELKKNNKKIIVFTERSRNYSDNALEVKNVYDRHKNFSSDLLKAVEELPEKPEIIHFQHAPDLFPDNAAFISLLKSISDKNIPVAVTLHTVSDDDKNKRFYNEILKYAHIIVHNDICRKILGNHEKVSVIFHGTLLMQKTPDREKLRHSIGFSEHDVIFLFAGFIHLQKNLHTAVRAFRKLHSKNRSLKLIVAGRPGGNRWYNKLYLLLCKILGFGSEIKWDIAFIENKKLEEYIQASDIILLPYWQKYASASGIFHLTIGAGKPFICSDSTKFDEIKRIISDIPVFVPAMSVNQWKNSMELLAGNKKIRDEAEQKIINYAEMTSWQNAAKMHLAFYKTITN